MAKKKFVDIVVRKEKGYNVISKKHVGPYSGANMLRKEFNDLVRLAKKKRVSTGKWFFVELDGPDVESSKRRWEASIEIKGNRKSEDLGPGIEAGALPPQRVASVIFDPDLVSARLVYHGLESWLDWQKKDNEFEEAGPTREVYTGNPWTDPKAWANLDIQVPIRKPSSQT